MPGVPRTGTRYRTRLAASVLLVSVPAVVVATAVATARATARVKTTAEGFLEARAGHVAADLDRFVAEQRSNLHLVALEASAGLPPDTVTGVVVNAAHTMPAFDELEIADLSGRVVIASDPAKSFDGHGESWFRDAAAGRAVLSPVYLDGDQLRWVVAEPLLSADGRPAGVTIGAVKVASLALLIDHADFARTGEVRIVNDARQLVLSTRAGLVTDDAAVRRAGALATTVDTPDVERGLAGQTGGRGFIDGRSGPAVLGGFTPVRSMGWVLVVKEDAAEALHPAHIQRRLGYEIGLAVSVALVVLAVGLAQLQSRRLRRLADETWTAAVGLRDDTTELSTAMTSLVTTAADHASSLTESSPAVGAVAATASSLEEHLDQVVAGSAEASTTLREAEADVESSTERANALAGRVEQLSALMQLVGEVTERTNVLALNAAIEAARAGEHGRGLTVIADEMQRLSDRTRASATDLEGALEDALFEANGVATDADKGFRQVHAIRVLLDQLIDRVETASQAAHQHGLTTAEVARMLGHLTDGGRRASVTAQQVATNVTFLAHLAAEVERTAEAARQQL